METGICAGIDVRAFRSAKVRGQNGETVGVCAYTQHTHIHARLVWAARSSGWRVHVDGHYYYLMMILYYYLSLTTTLVHHTTTSPSV